jgi:uncharacterized protein (TIGR00255 family)
MLQSMTGFASQTLMIEQEKGQEPIHLTIYLKSLNSRFFETNCKMPASLTTLEIDTIKTLKKGLYRGQVYVTIHMQNQQSLISEVSPSTETVASYLKAIKEIKTKNKLSGDIELSQLIRLPNVFSFKEVELNENTKQKIMDAIKKLTKDLIASRNQEGKVLLKDLNSRINNMDSLIKSVIKLSAINIDRKKEIMIAKIEKFSKEITDEHLLESQKAGLYNSLDKVDVHEEITRFCGHLKKLKSILKGENIEKGKSLDFTLQECNREINTIAAKASCLEINTLAIEVKVEIEKARQQVQNII